MITKGLLKAEQREVGLLYNTVTDTVPEEEKIQATEFFGSSCIKVHQLYSRPPSFVSLRILQKKVEFFKLKYWEQQPNDVIFSLYLQTRGEGCLYLERARDNYQNYDFESRLTVRIHSALKYYSDHP